TNQLASIMDRNTTFWMRATTDSNLASANVNTGITSVAGQTYLLVMKAEKTGGSPTYNQLSMWVNPSSAVEPAPTAVLNFDSGLNLSSSANFIIRQAFTDLGDTYL